jgi:hypothetical protein
MIRYLSGRGGNHQTKPPEPTKLPNSLADEYRELLELRERVRKAEAADLPQRAQGRTASNERKSATRQIE